MLVRLAAVLLLAFGLRGCVAYEYEHEFWLEVDGSGTVFVTGQPRLWSAFKGLELPAEPDALRQAARDLLERSGLRVRRVKLTRRNGRSYLFVAADFDDANRLAGTPAFPDLELRVIPEGERLRMEGAWRPGRPAPAEGAAGLMAVRFHLPSKIYHHRNAFEGVERGNIVAWRQDLARALAGRPLEFGAIMDRRSILGSTVGLFVGAIALGLGLLTLAVYYVFRIGRRRGAAMAASSPPGPGSSRPASRAGRTGW